MLTLASETRTDIDLLDLSRRIEAERERARYTSTQEDAWSLMAAHALMETLDPPELVVDGEPLDGPLFRGLDAESLAAAPLTIENNGDRPVEVGVTVRGVPVMPEPAGGNFYTHHPQLLHAGGRAGRSRRSRAGRAPRRRASTSPRPRRRARVSSSTTRCRPASRSTIRISWRAATSRRSTG